MATIVEPVKANIVQLPEAWYSFAFEPLTAEHTSWQFFFQLSLGRGLMFWHSKHRRHLLFYFLAFFLGSEASSTNFWPFTNATLFLKQGMVSSSCFTVCFCKLLSSPSPASLIQKNGVKCPELFLKSHLLAWTTNAFWGCFRELICNTQLVLLTFSEGIRITEPKGRSTKLFFLKPTLA